MAIDKKSGQQLACKIVDLRMLARKIEAQEKLKNQSSSRFFDNANDNDNDNDDDNVNDIRQPSIRIRKDGNRTAKLVTVRHSTARRCVSSIVRDKLKVYDREARVLEKLCHV